MKNELGQAIQERVIAENPTFEVVKAGFNILFFFIFTQQTPVLALQRTFIGMGLA